MVTLPRFDLEDFLRTIQDHKITRAFVAPPILLALAKHPLVDQYDLSSLRSILSGAAPLDEQLALAVEERLRKGADTGVTVAQGYGMTELSPVSHTTPDAGLRAARRHRRRAEGLGRLRDPEHRVPAGRPRHRRGRRRRASAASCGSAARR